MDALRQSKVFAILVLVAVLIVIWYLAAIWLNAPVILDRLMAEGVEFWAYPRMLHGKVMAVDDAWATLGSANMDTRSFRLNFEVNVAFPHAATARSVRAVIDAQLALCRRLAPEDFQFGVAGRLLRGAAGLLAPVL